MEKICPSSETHAEKFMKKIITIVIILTTVFILSACAQTKSGIPQKNIPTPEISPSPSASITPPTAPPEYIDGQPLEPTEDATIKNLNYDNLDDALKDLNEIE